MFVNVDRIAAPQFPCLHFAQQLNILGQLEENSIGNGPKKTRIDSTYPHVDEYTEFLLRSDNRIIFPDQYPMYCVLGGVIGDLCALNPDRSNNCGPPGANIHKLLVPRSSNSQILIR
jgi:hypothetical protein